MDINKEKKFKNFIKILVYINSFFISISLLSIFAIKQSWEFFIILLPFLLFSTYFFALLSILDLMCALFCLFKYKSVGRFVILIFFAMLLFIPYYFSFFTSKAQETLKEWKEGVGITSERYSLLLERFKSPQTVSKVVNRETIFIDESTSIIIFPTSADLYYSDDSYDHRLKFENYLKNNVVGKQVTIKLPSEDEFVKSYCCYGKGGYTDNFQGYVYFNGTLLNDLFGNL